MSERGRLSGRVAIVTGATSGIGRATATVLAAEGAEVMAAGRRQRPGKALAAEIVWEGGTARFMETDVTDPAQLERLVTTTVEMWGRLDILVNNAGAVGFGSVETTTDAEWDRIIATNLTSVFQISRVAIPHIRRTGGGSIVNVASVHAFATTTEIAAYAASKGAIVALSRQMALDFAADRIRVNAIVVGSVDTPMSQAHGAARGALTESHFDPTDVRPGRMGTPEEVARAVLFLASDDASFITGSPIIVDGGMLAKIF
jgi:NAD(P)-dependent dehydrogenase (short-subunit alcohol dehydrogenase family)